MKFPVVARQYVFTAVAVGVAGLLGSGAIHRAIAENGEPEKQGDVYANIGVFAKVLQLVRQDYVDEAKVGYQSLVRSALKGMLASLDPHSQYLEPNEFKSVQDDTQSRFSGVGIVVTQKDGRLIVVSVMEGGPALRAGVLVGDHLLKIGDQLTEKLSVTEAGNLLRGDVGRPAKLTLYRPAKKEVLELELVREQINVTTVKGGQLLSPECAPDAKIGYVRITQFNTPTAAELEKALEGLEKVGMQALVLDLRNNPGGVLNAAVDVAGQFLPANSLVVSTEGRVVSQNRVYRTATDGKPRTQVPVAILINNGSASASEILAGALKDLRRAILVGETTFGKGSVQSVIPLPDGSAVRLTTAKYYTPGRQVIHEHGIPPTIRVSVSAEQERLLAMKRREELLDESEKKEVGAFRDQQLERAVDALRAVVLYSVRSEAAGAPIPKK
ncbi:MAG: S41 family peptidase [Verrucomicrobiota bacterium]